jgi:antitoxin component YwqK of YwqJK toxin-antitoxin module
MIRQLAIFILLFSFFTSCKYETIEELDLQGNIEKFERRKSDFAKHGLYQRFSQEGQLLEEAHYQDNQLQGERTYYYPDGAVESTEVYENGVLHGKYKKFKEDGTLYIEQEFVNGSMEGWSIRYYPNGKIEEKVFIKDNSEDGPFYEYWENGNMKAEGTYNTNIEGTALEQGELKEYDESGTLIRTADCVDGRCTTTWKKEDGE